MSNRQTALLAGVSLAAAMPRAIVGHGVRADASDPAAILAALQTTFAEFRAVNDRRITALEAGRGDVLNEEQVNRISASLDELQAAHDAQARQIAALRLDGGGAAGVSPEAAAYSEAFNGWFRRGNGEHALGDLAVRAALTTTSDPDGGFVTPAQMDATISRVLANVSAMRGLAQVQPISAGQFKKLVSQGGATGGWAAERQARTETNSPRLSEIAIEAMELYAEPSATQTMLDDAAVNIETWLADEVSITFGEQEGAAFISGSGTGQPRGILSYATAADSGAGVTWGKLGFVGTGGVGFAADPAGLDAFEDLTYRLKKGYRVGATWLMNRKTIGTVRKMKDSQGRYQWEPSSQAGQPAQLFGFPVEDDDNMPDVASGAFPVAFGDFRRGYLIVDRIGVRVLRDPFTNKPYVMFYTTKRVGGAVQNFEAIKLLKCA